MATAWPWPYPSTYSQKESFLPKLTVEMNRADPFFERDATGWQFIDMSNGDVAVNYQLPNNQNRVVAMDRKSGKPMDSIYQASEKRIPPQDNY